MRIISKVAAIAIVLFAAVPAVTAGAAEDCTTASYCKDVEGNDAGSSDTGGGGAEVDDGPGPANSDGPANVESDGPAAPVRAPSGGLPITGGDVLGMATVGAVAIALGGVLVRRSKVAKQRAA